MNTYVTKQEYYDWVATEPLSDPCVEALEKIASCHSAFDGDVVSIAYKALAKHGR